MGFDLGQFKNIGDLKAVWDKMEDKSWTGFLGAISQVRAEKGNSETLDKAEQKAKEAADAHQDFPSNPLDLAKHLGMNA